MRQRTFIRMVNSKKIFIDDGVLYAFINRADEKHVKATAYMRYFAQEKYQVYTSLLNLEETYELVYRRISPSLALDFLRGITLSSISVIYPTENEIKASLKILINYKSGELTFKDSLDSVIANKNSIPQICTFRYQHSLFGLTTFYLPI